MNKNWLNSLFKYIGECGIPYFYEPFAIESSLNSAGKLIYGGASISGSLTR